MLSNYIKLFIASLDIRTNSKNTYIRQLKEFFKWYKINKLVSVSRQDLLTYKTYLLEKNLTPMTVAGYLTAVRRYFNYLESENIHIDIARFIKSPKRIRGFKKDSLNATTAKKLLNAIDTTNLCGLRDFAIINLILRTGLRTIEVVRANKIDISIQFGNSTLLVHGKGRDDKDEIVILTEKSLKPIREYLFERGKIMNNDPLFASHSSKNKGQRLTTRSISRIVKERMANIGIDDSRLTAHSLRHTAITFSLLGGATVQEAKSMARHADINTTMIYAHNIDRVKQAAEKKIDNIF